MSDLSTVDHEILARLDIRAELAPHVDFTKSEPNETGWLPCRAVGRDDASPSACVCVASANGSRGRYKDSGTGESCSFFDLWVKIDPTRFPTWKDARNHFADQLGMEIPGRNGKKSGGALLDQVRPANEMFREIQIAEYCRNNPPIMPASLDALIDAGRAMLCTWSGIRCIAFLAYRGDKLSGVILRRIDGQPFPAMGEIPERKTHLLGGSHDGWVIGGNIATATHVWVVEGVPDLLSLYPHLPAGHVVITNVCGASGGHGLPFEIVASKVVYVVGDCDDAGVAGAKKRATGVARHAAETRIVKMQLDHRPNHGADLRDAFGMGLSFVQLSEWAVASEIIAKPAEPTPGTQPEATASAPWIPAEGDVVKAKDRGNVGRVVSVSGGVVSVNFINPDDGNQATVDFSPDELMPPGAGADGKPRKPVERFSLRQLADTYHELHPIVIGGLIRERETANLISGSKIGKSWLAYNLACSYVTQQPWLGKFPTAGGNVLLADNELHRPTLAFRFKAVAASMGIRFEEIADQVEIWPLRGQLRSLFDLRSDFESVAGKFKLIIVDAKYRAMDPEASENDNSWETKFYNELDHLAEITGAAFLLIHHSSKGDQSEKRVTDVGAGAGAQSRAADCHIVLREHQTDGAAVLAAAVRSFPSPDPLAIRFTYPLWEAAHDLDPGQLRRPQSQAKSERDREADGKVLENCQTWKRIRQLQTECGMGPARVEAAIARLVKAGMLDRDVQEYKSEQHEHFRKSIHAP